MREKWKSKYNITTLSSLLILQNNEASNRFLFLILSLPNEVRNRYKKIYRATWFCGFAGRWTKRRRRKRGPWRQSKGASFEKARGHRTEPYVAITREKECAESGKVNGDTRKRIRGRRKRRRRRRKRIERQRSNQKGMNIHERCARTKTNSDRKWKMLSWMGIERSHFKIKCINLPRCARVLKAGSRGERSGCPVSPNSFSIIDNVVRKVKSRCCYYWK